MRIFEAQAARLMTQIELVGNCMIHMTMTTQEWVPLLQNLDYGERKKERQKVCVCV